MSAQPLRHQLMRLHSLPKGDRQTHLHKSLPFLKHARLSSTSRLLCAWISLPGMPISCPVSGDSAHPVSSRPLFKTERAYTSFQGPKDAEPGNKRMQRSRPGHRADVGLNWGPHTRCSPLELSGGIRPPPRKRGRPHHLQTLHRHKFTCVFKKSQTKT